jgi:hypothetical protein
MSKADLPIRWFVIKHPVHPSWLLPAGIVAATDITTFEPFLPEDFLLPLRAIKRLSVPRHNLS